MQLVITAQFRKSPMRRAGTCIPHTQLRCVSFQARYIINCMWLAPYGTGIF